MKIRPQITSVEETIRIPAWRIDLAEEPQHAPVERVAHDVAGELEDQPGVVERPVDRTAANCAAGSSGSGCQRGRARRCFG